MAEIRTATDRIGAALGDFVVSYRWLVILGSILIMAAAASGARHLDFSNNYRVFFSDKNPDLIAFDNFQETYTKNDNILFVLKPADGAVFSPRVAEAVERLTAEAWKIPYAIRVDSVTNFQHSWADGDDLTVEDLIRDGNGMAPEELARRGEIAVQEPLLFGNLIATDAATTGVNVTLQYPEKSLTEVPDAVGFARELAAGIGTDYPELEIALSGVSLLNNAFAESGQTDAMTLIPFMWAVLIGVMLVTLRSVMGTIATLLVIAFSTATALGIAGTLGIKLTPISITAPTIILTLAIADSVHIIISMIALMREGQDKISALKESLRINFLAVSVTSLTTIIGFSTLNFSDAPPFWDLGNITAIGIAAAWVFSLGFLPAVLSLMPMRVKVSEGRSHFGGRVMDRIADFVIARYRYLLIGVGTAAVGLIAAVPTLELNDEWVKYFDHRVPFRGDAEFAIENLSGLYLIEFSVEAAEAGGISEPVYLDHLKSFTA